MKRNRTGREGGRFIALPHSVLESPAYLRLKHPARALLLEFALQYRGDDNGRLLCSEAHLKKRGWKSNGVITRAKRELLEAGFIHETVKGQRPNKASWYAVTWITLDRLTGYDPDAAKTFERGAYRKINGLTPSHGVAEASIGLSQGVERAPPTLSKSPMRGKTELLSTLSESDPLEKPSITDVKRQDKRVRDTGGCE
jgi:hypothetical protein